MLWALRILFVAILGSMLAVTGWASTQCALSAIPREVWTHPWFIATLVDAYWGFVTFYVWAAWKERGWAARILWLVAVLALGNIAMAVYLLPELFAVDSSKDLALVATRRNSGRLGLPVLLVALSILVYSIA